MRQAIYRNNLPQLSGSRMLTDGGLETTMVFHEGLDLPMFAAFDLLRTEEGKRALRRYYGRYAEIARHNATGFILDSVTWRASRDWGDQLGYSGPELEEANRRSVDMLFELREEHERGLPFVINGVIGPRGDGYRPESMMSAGEAAAYHRDQIRVLDQAGVDMLSAITMTHAGEAAGIARVAAEREVPVALSFTVETDGRLPSGQPLGEAIEEVDATTGRAAAYYMINCAHPDHFRGILADDADWKSRVFGIRANASRLSHAELDEAVDLDDGNPEEFGADYAELIRLLPNLRVFGGCCGTDHRHVACAAERIDMAAAA